MSTNKEFSIMLSSVQKTTATENQRGNIRDNTRGKAKYIIRQFEGISNAEFKKNRTKDSHYLPSIPSADHCFLHYYMTHKYVSWYSGRNAILPPHLDEEYVLKMSGYANLTRASSWRLRNGQWFDHNVVDCYLMFLQLNEKNRSYEGKKRIWYLSTIYGATNDLRDMKLYEQFSGDWEEMGYIAVPLNVHDCHWFMMAISFIHKEIFILDSNSGCGYTETNIKAKVRQIHNTLTKESKYEDDITSWNVWYMNDDVPQQPNGNDCGPFMCFFMTHLRDLIPIPQKQFVINIEYIRIWLANEMARSVYNLHNEDFFEGLRNFKVAEENQKELPRCANTSSECTGEPTNEYVIKEQLIQRRCQQRDYYARLPPEEKQNQIKKVVEIKKTKKSDTTTPTSNQKNKDQIIQRRTRQRNYYANLSQEEKQNQINKVQDNRKRKESAVDVASTSNTSAQKENDEQIARRRVRQRNRYLNLAPEEKKTYVRKVVDNRKKKKGACDTSSTSGKNKSSTIVEQDAVPNKEDYPTEFASHKKWYATLTPKKKQDHIKKVDLNRKRRKSVHNLASTSNSKGSTNNGPSHLKLSEPHRLREQSPCIFCSAIRLEHEPPTFCCQKGKVHLPVTSTPDSLYKLFNDQSDEALEFRRHIRAYNSIFSFTSMGVKLDKDLASSRKGVYTFRAQGQIYHDLPSLKPVGESPCYFQMYFYDTDNEIDNRLKVLNEAPLSRSIVQKLMEILSDNPYAQVFRQLTNTDLDTYEIHISTDVKLDQRVYNSPTADQVAAIWIEGNDPSVSHQRDIIVHSNSGDRHRVQHYFGCYDPLQYPLLFPHGEMGWHQNILKRKPSEVLNNDGSDGHHFYNFVPSSAEAILRKEKKGTDGGSRTNVSCREYYCYKFQIRDLKKSIVLRSGRLLQQYIVDMYIKLENTRLDFYRNKQSELRAELYQGIVDSVLIGERRGYMVGKSFLLPPSFVGGPRDLRRKYLDAMALVQRFGKPDLFITMTCNPEWHEIKALLEEGEQPQDRPEVVVRVFRAKYHDLKSQLFKKNIFGMVAAHVHVIEFQKRGLPHVHMLIIFKKQHKITSADQFDRYVCAEIPDPDVYPDLHEKVVRHMMHGPCGVLNKKNPCMQDGKCKSKYPRPYCEETTLGDDSYAIYRRRKASIKVRVRSADLDNRWVVPYNPYLLSRYNCHINVEICSGIKAVKYLYKYIYKGHDKVEICVDQGEIRGRDEIREFQNGRWVSPQEAIWRIFEFKLHEMSPAVINLQLHLPNKHFVAYWKHQDLSKLLLSDTASKTMLTEFFNFCLNYKGKRKFLYREFPEYFVWDGTTKSWNHRKTRNVIGRINGANPQEGERYYMRLLLNHVRSPTSYLDLLRYNGIQHLSFKAAAEKRGLLQSDDWISECLLEAASFQMPLALRRLFATILVHCEPTNVKDLWNKHFQPMSEDFLRNPDLTAEQCLVETLKSIDYFLQSMGRKIEQFDLETVTLCFEAREVSEKREIRDELAIETPPEDYGAAESLNSEQKHAYDIIIHHVESNMNEVFFIDGPGGTGKTFLYRALLATIRSRGFIGIATATSGVAASIMPGGRTSHSRFKIPIDVNESSTCNIPKQSGTAELLRRAKLLIWDEAPMAKRWAIETLDRSLQDLMGNNMLFGGKIVVFGGDFRQVLPVVPRGTRAETVNASLVKSYIWPKLKKLKLTKNMRARNDSTFSNFLLNVGDGNEPTISDDMIRLPAEMVIKHDNVVDSETLLINTIFPSLHEHAYESDYVTERAILATRNEHVDMLNEKLIQSFPGMEQRYASFDKAIDDSHNYYPEEFLNTLMPNGLPPHELILKVNSPIMLLRNLNPSDGLCNGTRMVCKGFERNVIHAEITLGQHAGKQVLIPRIPLQPAENENYPFQFHRTQFPVRLCFAMTINKAQGQTIPHVGVFLPEHVFSHGQLYVALSRGTSMSTTKVLIKLTKPKTRQWDYTKNIVFKEVLSS